MNSVYWGQHLAGVEDVVRVEQSLDSAHQPDERRALRHVQELRLHRTFIVSVSVSVGVRVSVGVGVRVRARARARARVTDAMLRRD